MPSVQTRILEERGNPEERCVRVRDLEVAREEQRAGVRLPDSDRGEQRAERDERDRSARGSQSASGARATTASPATNGNTKNASARRSRAVVPRPQERRRGERDEGGERKCDQKRGRRGPLATEDLVAECEDGGCDGEVERKQQERFLVAELHGNAKRSEGEEHDGHDRRVAGERHRTGNDGDDADGEKRHSRGLVHQQAEIVTADERPRQSTARGAQEHESGQGRQASPGHEDEECTERPDERSHLSGVCVLHGGSTLRRRALDGVAEETLGLRELGRHPGDCVGVLVSPLLGAGCGQRRA